MNRPKRIASLLVEHMVAAWQSRLVRAVNVLQAAATAPCLVKPDAVEQARRDYARAVAEVGRWSA